MQTNFDAIALVGFSTFEYSTFETFFRLVSGRRVRQYRAVRTGEQARLVIVDGSNASLVTRLVERLRPTQTAIIVGFSDHGTGLTVIPRPINLSMVLSVVDRLFAGHVATSVAAAVPPSVATTVSSAINALAPFATPAALTAAGPTVTELATPPATRKIEPTLGLTDSSSPDVARDASQRVEPKSPAIEPPSELIVPTQLAPPQQASAIPAVTASAPVVPSAKAGANVLVVDDSDVALKFIHNRLSAFGFQVDLASSGEEALVRVSENQYSFVFLDVMMEGLDGYQTCKAIKKRKFQNGHSPVVVMLTSRGGTVDKVRGTFAGCDAYLTKPLDETKMLRVLLKHDAGLSSQIETYTTYGPGQAVPGANEAMRAPRSDGEQHAQEEAARIEFLARLDQSAAIRSAPT